MSRVRAWIGLMLAALAAGACGEEPTTPTLPSPTTSEFASQLAVNSSVGRAFTATQNGVVTVTLDEAGPAGTQVGLGIGIPYVNTVGGCTLNKTVTATAGAGPHLSETVDAGRYCIAIFDTGTLTAPINFKITIVFP